MDRRDGGDAPMLYNRNGQAALPPWELADSIYVHPHGSSAYNKTLRGDQDPQGCKYKDIISEDYAMDQQVPLDKCRG